MLIARINESSSEFYMAAKNALKALLVLLFMDFFAVATSRIVC